MAETLDEKGGVVGREVLGGWPGCLVRFPKDRIMVRPFTLISTKTCFVYHRSKVTLCKVYHFYSRVWLNTSSDANQQSISEARLIARTRECTGTLVNWKAGSVWDRVRDISLRGGKGGGRLLTGPCIRSRHHPLWSLLHLLRRRKTKYSRSHR